MNQKTEKEFRDFIEEWKDSSEKNKELFLHFKDYLSRKEGVQLTFVARPGITYSLRASYDKQEGKELFVMIDVIEDTPRWLSICFYEEMVHDPESIGDFVPGGLLGEDAVCIDLAEWDEKLTSYVEKRLDEAYSHAAG